MMFLSQTHVLYNNMLVKYMFWGIEVSIVCLMSICCFMLVMSNNCYSLWCLIISNSNYNGFNRR